MKKVVLLMLVLVNSFFGFAQNHKVYCSECNSGLQEEGTTKNGRKEGYWKYYYAHITGHRIREEGNYENDKKNGIWKSYSPYGELNLTTQFVNGLENGESITFDISGWISSKRFFLNGKLQGDVTEFYHDGRIKSILNTANGEFKSFYLNGQTESIGFSDSRNYLNKEGEWMEYHQNGSLKQIGSYKDNSPVGIWKEYYNNAQLKSKGEKLNGNRVGKWEAFHPNGKLSGVGEYMSDGYPLPNSWITYNEEGLRDSIDCPEPTSDKMLGLFLLIYNPAVYEGPYNFVYTFQEELWRMAGLSKMEYPKLLPTAKLDFFKNKNIRQLSRMWGRYREKFISDGFITSVASGRNIMKFSIDVNTVFIIFAVKYCGFDLNFVDPSDSETVLDFLDYKIDFTLNSPPIDYPKVDEYKRIRDLLIANGVKHANELK